MHGVLIEEFGKLPVVANLSDPTPAPVARSFAWRHGGICQSDWHGWMGRPTIALPHVPGHELAGTVVAVGRDVRRWKEGGRVTLPFATGCGRCEECGHSKMHDCC